MRQRFNTTIINHNNSITSTSTTSPITTTNNNIISRLPLPPPLSLPPINFLLRVSMGNKSTYTACPRDSFTRRHRLECYPRTIPRMRCPPPPLLLSPLAPPPRQPQHSRTTQRPLRRSSAPQPLLCSSLLSTWGVLGRRPVEGESEAVQWDAE